MCDQDFHNMVPHARTLRKAREQVKAMVTDDVSSESMGAKVAKNVKHLE